MKIKIVVYLIMTISLSQLCAQELRMMPLDMDVVLINITDFDFEAPLEDERYSFFQMGSDMFNMKLVGYSLNTLSVTLSSRLEEELPYENNRYEYGGFYYLDFGLSYILDKFSLSVSAENFLNLGNDAFSIDPILEASQGIVNHYYFSHETDTTILMTLRYTFN